MGELEVELNKSYDWSKILDGNEEIEMMDGPGYKGLRNIGSSCYMNAVVQTMLAVQEVCNNDDDDDDDGYDDYDQNHAIDHSLYFLYVSLL